MARSPLVMPRGQRVTAPGAAMRTRTAGTVVVAAVVLGVASAGALIGETPPFGASSVGPWQTFPRLGSAEIDPYSRAILARGPHLPLSVGEGVSFFARADSEGRALTGACAYRVSGATLPSRGWTLTLTDEESRPQTGGRASALTDADLVTPESGLVDIALTAMAVPGAWLKTPHDGRFGLVLQFYDTPLSASVAQLGAEALPRIERAGCRG